MRLMSRVGGVRVITTTLQPILTVVSKSFANLESGFMIQRHDGRAEPRAMAKNKPTKMRTTIKMTRTTFFRSAKTSASELKGKGLA
jgi:hypothetical protein